MKEYWINEYQSRFGARIFGFRFPTREEAIIKRNVFYCCVGLWHVKFK